MSENNLILLFRYKQTNKIMYDKLSNSFHETWKSSSIKAIIIQGPTASGKTTLANILKNNLKDAFIITLDNYNKTKVNKDSCFHSDSQIRASYTNVDDYYNYDNPGAMDWHAVRILLDEIDSGCQQLTTYKYDYKTSTRLGPIKTNRPIIKFLIVEGVYANYLFDEITFDVSKYDPLKRPYKYNDSMMAAFYVKQTHFYKNIAHFALLLKIDKQKMRSVKLERDSIDRCKNTKFIEHQIDEQSWPATVKYVYNRRLRFDYIIEGGSWNESVCSEFLDLLIKYCQTQE